MGWWDSEEERDDYLWTVHNFIPSTAGMWGQPMFSLKVTSCEDPTRESCSCVLYDEKHPKSEGITFSNGAVWSAIMAQSEEDLMSDENVDANM